MKSDETVGVGDASGFGRLRLLDELSPHPRKGKAYHVAWEERKVLFGLNFSVGTLTAGAVEGIAGNSPCFQSPERSSCAVN